MNFLAQGTRNFSKLDSLFALTCNVRHFEISPATGGGGGAFWPGPRKEGYGYWIDLKFATNNGTSDTSKHAKFDVSGCSTFRDMTSQKVPFRRERVTAIRYLPPGIEENSKKSLFSLKTSFLEQNYTPLSISMQNKNIHMFNFSRRLI